MFASSVTRNPAKFCEILEQLSSLNPPDLTDQKFQEQLRILTDVKGRSILMGAIEKGEEKLSEELIKRNITVQTKDSQGNSALHLASKFGSLKSTHSLLKKLQINEQNEKGRTPLIVAIKYGRNEIVRSLFENGAIVDFTFDYKGLKLTPLAFAAIRGEIECIRYLSENFQIGKHQVNGASLLHLVIQFHQNHVLRYLLENQYEQCVSYLESVDEKGNTPFAKAVIIDNREALEILNQYKVNQESKNHENYRPIHLAALFQPHLIPVLVYLGCDLKAFGGMESKPAHLLIDQSCYPEEYNYCCNLLTHEIKFEHSSPQFGNRPPQNLVFKGGGPKGIAYLGALEVLESKKILSYIKRVGGTSAGAINSALLACGYGVKETRQLLEDKNLLDFIDHPRLKKTIKNHPPKFVAAARLFLDQIWKKLRTHPRDFLAFPFHNIYDSIKDFTGFCEGNDFSNWMEEKIREKTKIPFCTFGKLRKLASADTSFKQLHVFLTDLSGSRPKIVRVHSEDTKWDNVTIASAVRASMSIPFVYNPVVLQVEKEGQIVSDPSYGIFVDGGLINNLPIEAFDTRKYTCNAISDVDQPEFNKRTLGFTLYTPKNEIEKPKNIDTLKDLVKGIVSVYRGAEEIIREQTSYNKARIIEISNKGVGMLDFDLSDEKKKELILAGKEATEAFFKQHPCDQNSLFPDMKGSKESDPSFQTQKVNRSDQSPTRLRPPPPPTVPLAPPNLSGSLEASSRSSQSNPPIPEGAFGPEDWEIHFGDVGEVPPLPSNIEEILDGPCPFWPEKRVRETHSLVLVPSKVKGNNLTLDYFENLLRQARGGSSCRFRQYSKKIREIFGQREKDFSHWALVTKDVIPQSRGKSLEEAQSLIQNVPGYFVPELIDFVVTLFAHTLKTKRRIFTDSSSSPEKKWTFSYCKEEGLLNGDPLVVGGFSREGLSIDNKKSRSEYYGMGASLRLSAEIGIEQATNQKRDADLRFPLPLSLESSTSTNIPIEPVSQSIEINLSIPGEAFGPEDWKAHFGDPGEVPPLPEKIEKILDGPCPFWPGKQVRDTHFLICIPEKVNNLTLTMQYFETLAKNPKKGSPVGFTNFNRVPDQNIKRQKKLRNQNGFY